MIPTKKKRKFKKRYVALSVLLAYVIICQSCMTMRMSERKTRSFFEKSATDYISKTIDFGDHKIHYVQTGDENKPTLLFVHGSPGSWDAYKEYLKDTLLLKKYRMIAIDRPGFGHSDFGQAEDLKTQSDFIMEFLKTVDNKKAIVLVGHSMGGPVITKMATESPKIFKDLVILAGSVDPKAETPENWRPILMTRPLRYLIPGAMRPANDELWWLKKDLVLMKPFVKNITSSITVIHGTKDRLVPYSNVAFIQKEFVGAKNIDVISIENADHFIPWTHFEIIRDALLHLKLE